MSIDLSATTVSNAFYWGELENELRDLGMMDFTIKADSDREACMEATCIEEKGENFCILTIIAVLIVKKEVQSRLYSSIRVLLTEGGGGGGRPGGSLCPKHSASTPPPKKYMSSIEVC